MMRYDAAVIGGGASGLFAASVLCEAGLRVLIAEPNRFLGRKLRITGKGRCNLTNNCTPEDVMKNVLRNPKFLYSALNGFPPEKIMEWFEAHGVPLKTERGRRVFPVSDRAADVAESMEKVCKSHGCRILHSEVTDIIVEDGIARGISSREGDFYSDCVICACGGKSYPKTGSDGRGYLLAQKLGHCIIRPEPSLVPVILEDDICGSLDGLALRNVTLSLYDSDKPKKPLFSELGELTFQSDGICGPLGISASCYMTEDKLSCKAYRLYIDLKPGLDRQKLDQRLLRDISAEPSQSIKKLADGLLPASMADAVIMRSGLDKSASAGSLRREERLLLIELLKRFELTPYALGTFDEAIITRGGVNVSEISSSTMESKLVKGLYFTGEIIDVDALTGGYNLTVAFSTAYSAAADIIRKKDVVTWD